MHITVSFTVIGNVNETYKWEEHGFTLEVPATALPEGTTVTVAVDVVPLSDDFVLRDDVYLVSDIFKIQCSGTFEEEVAVCIPHTAIIESDDSNHVNFFTAKHTEGPPYKFEELSHGQILSKCGKIKVKQFSWLTIGSKQYHLQAFYCLKSLNLKYIYMKVVVLKEEEDIIKV